MITIPNEWGPRPYQLPFLQAMGEKKRACLVWHRRAGKDSAALNYTATRMFDRVGNYWTLFPKQTQARKAIWNGIDGQGRKILSQAFPEAIRARTQSQEMMIELKNGSTWQLCGSDNYDSLVGSNPVGVVFSEWPLCDPMSWSYIRPMLAENGGWAVFIYTARGKNHGYSMYKMAKDNPDWYCEVLTVDDTQRDDGSPVIPPSTIDAEREEGMREDLIQQEYYCSFDASIPGAYYAKEMAAAHADKRIGFVPIEPKLKVHTFWDLGISDAMAIWFVQAVGKEIRAINYYENTDEGMQHYINYLDTFAKQHNITYGEHYAPHDIEVRELSSGKTRRSTAQEMGLTFRVVPIHKLADGIEATRKIIPRMWFDEKRCEHGISCLTSYHREYDDKRQVYRDIPVHDWSSHCSDSLRQMAMAWNEQLTAGTRPMEAVIINKGFNPLARR